MISDFSFSFPLGPTFYFKTMKQRETKSVIQKQKWERRSISCVQRKYFQSYFVTKTAAAGGWGARASLAWFMLDREEACELGAQTPPMKSQHQGCSGWNPGPALFPVAGVLGTGISGQPHLHPAGDEEG